MVFDFATSALVIVDMQEEGRADGKWPVDGFDSIVVRIAQLLAAYREQGLPIVHVMTRRLTDGSDAPPLAPRYADGQPEYGADRDGGELIAAELTPLPGEVVIEKRYSSAFRETDLELALRGRGIKGLVVAGVWTEECVLLTVKDAIDLGFPVWLVEDACGSGDHTTHDAAVNILKKRLYGGGSSSTAGVLAHLGSASG